MKKLISKICAITVTISFTMSLTTIVKATTYRSSYNSFKVSPHQTQKLASNPNLIPTCNGEPAPCVTRPTANQSGNKITFQWSGAGDFYNIRYRVSGGEKQVENRLGYFTLTNVQPNRIYSINIQACKSNFLSRSSCTTWETGSFTTR